MTTLKEAVADITEMFREVATISHPYTDSHVSELERRCQRIGASLQGEDRNRFDAVMQLGLAAVAEVQNRNAVDAIEVIAGAFVTTASGAPLSGQPRWEEKLESLEYALAGFGVACARHGDDAVTVAPLRTHKASASNRTYTYGTTPKDVISKNLPVQFPATFTSDDVALIHEVGHDVAALKSIRPRVPVKLPKATVEILLERLAESDNDEAFSLRTSILEVIGIEEV